MPFQPIANTARVTCTGRQTDAEVWANVFHAQWLATSAYDESVRAAMGAAFLNFYGALESFYPDTWSLDTIQIRSIETEGSPTFTYPVAGIVGTSSSNPLPPQVAPCISWAVGAEETRKKGRTYLPAPIATLTTDSGGISETFKDAAGAAAVQLMADLSDGTDGLDSLVVVSRIGSGSAEAVTAAYIDQWYDTQRGRRDSLISSYEKYV